MFSSTYDFAPNVTFSLAWALFGLDLLMIGIRISTRIAVTTLKLFFFDLWRLGQLCRVAAFVGLAIALILAATLCQRQVSAESGERSSG